LELPKERFGEEEAMTTEYTGGCLCGAVRYRVTGVVRAGYCHCRMCQKASGAPVVVWLMVPAERYEMVRGKVSTYHSSAGSYREFCGNCGTQLFSRRYEAPNEVDINLATLDHPEMLVPQYHIYTASQMPWLDIEDALPRFAEGRMPSS
jgi:hypothetical protein